ncbi:MAG: inorganic phosphate transporter [candidate division Zixibacteria bacterium]|nr:inorganic phosphate transporter [candidate division Zixibacteria bacterium]
MESFGFLILIFLLAIAFDFVNGWTDACNSIATVISTRVLSPQAAILMAAFFNLVGALSGTAVAVTIGKGLVATEAVNLFTIATALFSVIIWSSVATVFGLPTSESHGLMAGLAGAVIASAGTKALIWAGWRKVFLGLVFAPTIGFGIGLLFMVLLLWVFRRFTPSTVGGMFRKLQIASAAFMAFSHGSNDAQKTMGIMTLALAIHFHWSSFHVPLWVIFLSATTMGLGTAFGGWRVIRTMGMRITKLEPIHGFAAETSAAVVITAASRMGLPLSTTHVIASGIMGVGATKRLSAVRWGVAGNIVLAWILTFPICGGISWLLTTIVNQFI